jgi:hypothetical protein
VAADTEAPTTSPTNVTPSLSPTPDKHATTSAPVTAAPVTAAPTAASTDNNPAPPKKPMTFLRIIGKTIAWLIIIALSVVAFGAIMSNRYRIYFFLRGVWYTVLRMDCTSYLMRKLRFWDNNSQGVDSSLNTIIFDNEMTEGLLMREDN